MSGYSKTPLFRKIGYKEGNCVLWMNAPEVYYSLLGDQVESLEIHKNATDTNYDVIHIFSMQQSEMKVLLAEARDKMVQNGMIWLSWPKKASKIDTDLSEAVIREMGLAAGLVDTKVASINAIWSGHRFVIPVANRT